MTDISAIHHVEVYVEDIEGSARFYRTVLGFGLAGRVHPDHCPGAQSMALERGAIRLLLTSPVGDDSSVAAHLRRHGEGVKDVALSTGDVEGAFMRAVAAGAMPIRPPSILEDGSRTSVIGACGDVTHSLIEPGPESHQWISTLVRDVNPSEERDTSLEEIDHVAFAVGHGELDRAVDLYVHGLGFRETQSEHVSTEYSAMRSKVLVSANGAVRFPMMEPATGLRKSQIANYIDSHDGAGVQHIALGSHDIVKTLSCIADRLQFLPTPSTYYDALERRVGDLNSELDIFRRHGILVDRDAAGVLLQVFTTPIANRPTLFLEIIERRGAAGFGAGNIRALFEAVERLQS